MTASSGYAVEETFEGEPTGIEVEHGDNAAVPRPWDPAKIRVSTKPLSDPSLLPGFRGRLIAVGCRETGA